jgi:O-antigen ligase
MLTDYLATDSRTNNAVDARAGSRTIAIWPVVVFLNLYTGAFSSLLEGLPLVLEGALLPGSAVAAFVLALVGGAQPVRVSLVALMVVVLQVMSLAWSYDVSTSTFFVRTEVASLLFLMLVVGSFTVDQMRALLVRTAAVAITLSFAAILAMPESRTVAERDRSEGIAIDTWRALYPHKNSMGVWIAVHTVVVLALASRRQRIALAAGGAVLVLGSRSVTALLTLGFGVLVYLWARSMFRRGSNVSFSLSFVAGTAVIATMVAVQNLSTLVAWFGKDPTLTGRTAIWSIVWDAVLDRPLVGYGPAGFWYVDDEFRALIDRGIGFGVFQAHQGVLELLLLFGVVGFVLVAAILVTLTRDAVRLGTGGDHSIAAAALAVVGMIVLASLSEPMFTRGGLDLLVILTAGFGSALRLPGIAAPQSRSAKIDASEPTFRSRL